MQHTVVISFKGNFYYAYEESAIIIHNLLGYKLKESRTGNLSCGFPETALGKVTIQLNKNEISYQVYKDTKEQLMILLGEKHFDNPDNFIKFSKMSSIDEATEFINTLCEFHERAIEGKLFLGQGISATLNLADEEVGRKLKLIQNYFKEGR